MKQVSTAMRKRWSQIRKPVPLFRDKSKLQSVINKKLKLHVKKEETALRKQALIRPKMSIDKETLFYDTHLDQRKTARQNKETYM